MPKPFCHTFRNDFVGNDILSVKMSYCFRRKEKMSDSCYDDKGADREGRLDDYSAMPMQSLLRQVVADGRPYDSEDWTSFTQRSCD